MNKLPIAAAALLFGTSAYAMATQPTGVRVDKDPYVVTGTTAAGTAGDAFTLQPAAVDWWGTPPATEAKSVAYTGDGLAVADEADKAVADDAIAGEPVHAIADEAALAPAPEPVSYETSAVDEAPIPVADGVGGPDAHIDIAAADLAPRPAAQNYPACRPGPGDDNCIQLYEQGVPERLAAWSQPTGGFAGSADARVAMGGPYEPVDNSAIETARADDAARYGDGKVDTALGETPDDEDDAEV